MDRANARTSQRPSRTCLACFRSKVRCSKTIPCTRCIAQGRADSCQAQRVQIATRQTRLERRIERNLLQRLRTDLRHRRPADVLAFLDGWEAAAEADGDTLSTGGPDSPRQSISIPSVTAGSDSPDPGSPSDAGLALTLEYLAWGRQYRRTSEAGSSPPRPPTALAAQAATTLSVQLHDDLVRRLALPPVAAARALVHFHVQHLCWHHNALYAPTFVAQCERFWATGRMGEAAWMSLYLAVLSTAAWSFPEHEPDHSLPTPPHDSWKAAAATWYDGLLVALNESNYIAHHSVCSIQAIAISTLVAHPLGHSNAHYILLSAAIRIAQCLGLDRLPAEGSGSRPATTAEDWDARVREQTGRRVWWQLVIQDYFAVPFVDTYTIQPQHFTTPLPRHCDDDLEERPTNMPTTSSYCLVLAKMASLMPTLVNGAHRHHGTSTQQRYQHVLDMDVQMRRLVANMPAFLLRQTPEDPSWPPWVSWARRTLTISAADKIIMIHRAFLIQSFRSPVYAYTRATCLAAAGTILREYERIVDTHVASVWIVPAFAISAGIIVALDLLYRVGSDSTADMDAARRLLRVATDGLAGCRHNKMAMRGAGILQALVQEEQDRRLRGDEHGKQGAHDSSSAARPIDMERVKQQLARGTSPLLSFPADPVERKPDLGPDGLLGSETAAAEDASVSAPPLVDEHELESWFNGSLSWNAMAGVTLQPLRNATFSSDYGCSLFDFE